MLGRTHIMAGLFIALLFMFFFRVENDFLFIFIVLTGSVLPDVDRSSSLLGRFFSNASSIFRHRGFFHSFYAMVIFSLAVYSLLGLQYASIFMLAYLAHLVLDSFTKKGVSFFVFDRRVNGKAVSGGLVDSLLFLLLISADVILVILQ